MAIYHLHVQPIGRGTGRSAIAAAAYRSTTKLIDNETGIICDYSRKSKALDAGIIAPEGSPKWVMARQKLWDEVQKRENRKNSQFCWEYDIALPHEVKHWGMINRFCQDNFVKKGLICDYAVHKPDKKGDKRNCHVHIMVTTRKMTAEGWGEKYRHGENKMNDRKEWLNEVRKSWENICNEELERIKSPERVDCRTLEAQGIERIPTQHQGYVATDMQRRGAMPNRLRQVPDEEAEAPASELEQIKRIEAEEKILQEKIRLANLPAEDFQKEYKTLEAIEYKAAVEFTGYREFKDTLDEIAEARAESVRRQMEQQQNTKIT